MTINRPRVIDAKHQDYSEFKDTLNDVLDRTSRTKYDGVIIKNYVDAGKHGGRLVASTHYIPFSTGQIKVLTENVVENEDDWDWEGWEADVNPAFMQTPYERGFPATDENIARAKAFVWRKWLEFCQEKGHPTPKDLSNSCKFGSMFAQEIFGGVLRGNNAHHYCLLPNGKIIDFSADAADVLSMQDPYEHNDRTFWGNPEHEDALMSCMPRVDSWAKEFRREVGLTEATHKKNRSTLR